MAVGTLSFVRTGASEVLPPPSLTRGPLAWMRANLFSSPGNAVLTILFLLLLAWVVPPIVRFMFTEAVWSGANRDACREDVVGHPVGACWAFVRDRVAYFTYGSYPLDARWRVDLWFALMAFGAAWMLWLEAPARGLGATYFFVVFPVASFILLTGGHASASKFLLGYALPLGPGAAGFWTDFGLTALIVAAIGFGAARAAGTTGKTVLIATAGFFAALGVLLFAMQFDWGLEEVPTALWGGILVTLVVSIVGVVLSLPLGVMLALGRRSRLPVVKFFCITFIEVVRGVPLITVLIMANAMLPLFLPVGWSVDRLMRPLIGVSLFSAAYMAETVRGGLQAIPKGQYEGAMSLGLGYWKMMYFIVLPQALRIVIPGIVSTFIGLFKDTTLVSIVGLLDFVRTIEASRVDPVWAAPTVGITGYVFAGLFYFVFCFGMSRYSLMIERRLAAGQRR